LKPYSVHLQGPAAGNTTLAFDAIFGQIAGVDEIDDLFLSLLLLLPLALSPARAGLGW